MSRRDFDAAFPNARKITLDIFGNSDREGRNSSKVVKKQANKAALAAAEPVERMDGAKENADLQTTVRTQSREAVSQAQGRIR